MTVYGIAFLFSCSVLFANDAWQDAPWSVSLSHDGGSVWKCRVPVSIKNETAQPMEGNPVPIPFVAAEGPSVNVHEIRLTKDDGQELLFSVFSQNGKLITEGLFPASGSLVIPCDCHPGQSANYFVYFDNVKAERIPEFLDAKTEIVNSAPKVSIEPLNREQKHSPVSMGKVQTIPYVVSERKTDWPKVSDGDYLCRSTFRVVNQMERSMDSVPIMFTIRGTLSHGLRGPLRDLYVLEDNRKLPVVLLDQKNSRGIVRLNIPAKTIRYFDVYYRFEESKAPNGLKDISDQKSEAKNLSDLESQTAHPDFQVVVDPFSDIPNLLKNGDFEAAPRKNGSIDGWRHSDAKPSQGVQYTLESDPAIVRFGKQCVRLDLPKDAPVAWRGWTQRVEIQPGSSYLVQGWLKTQDLSGARIHLHFYDATGKIVQGAGLSSVGPDLSGTTDWTRLAEVIRTPADAQFMTIHLTTNGHGVLWHDNIAIFDGIFAEQIDRESFWKTTAEQSTTEQSASMAVWQVPAIVKVFPQTIPSQADRTERQDNVKPCFRIEAARNEKEPLQLAFRGDHERKIKIEVIPPKNAAGFSLDDFEVNIAGYVPVDYPSNYYNTRTPKWYRKIPTTAPGCDGWKGLWPDPLLPYDSLLLKKDTTESAWITWSIPKDAPAGIYFGEIRCTTESDGKSIAFPIELTVRNFTLPDAAHVSAIYDVRFGPGTQHWGKSLKDSYREIVRFMTENRLAPDSLMPDPKMEFKVGKVQFDWTEFDRTAQWLIEEQKVQRLYLPRLFYSFGWAHPPKKFFNEQPYEGEWPFKDADVNTIRPEYKALYQNTLREFWEHLKEKGWADHFVLYVSDEPHYKHEKIIDQMKAVCKMIHEVDPKIPIYSSTWRFVPEWIDSLDVWGIGHYGIVPEETMKEIKQHGSKIWITTDGMLCLDTPYSAIERLLPYYCWKYGAEAYEFWGVGWLTHDPYKSGTHAFIRQSSTPGDYYWVRYPNGDGYLIYPGVPLGQESLVASVRFAQAREGVEDFEYFYLLSELMERAKKEGKSVLQAEDALAAVCEMVDCPSPTGRYSSQILPNPIQLYEVRRRVAEAIENFEE